MSIQNFYTQTAQRDFARPFQFRLQQLANIAFKAEDHLVYVETASLPGRQINNVQVPYMGLSFNVPGTASYPGSAGYNVTFRCDAEYNLREALEAATFNTFDETNSTGDYNMPTPAYPTIFQLLGKQMEVVREYTMVGAYVVSIADASYDIKDSGTIQTIQATMAYQYWTASRGASIRSTNTQVTPTINGAVIRPPVWGAVKQ